MSSRQLASPLQPTSLHRPQDTTLPPSRPASSYTLDRKPLPRPDSIHQPRPTAQLGHGRSHPHRRYLTGPRLRSILYHSSFYLFCVLEAVLLVGTAWGLASQAWHGTRNRRWNIVLLTAAYVAVAIISLLHVWSRLLSIKGILKTMPKPYIPTKQIDVPRKVADHIMTEYSRTAVIAHISQATTGQQEGWGRPGTKWENQHFRSFILSTLPIIKEALAPHASAPPLSLNPLFVAADRVGDNGAIRLFVNSYAKFIDQARFSRREPTEMDAAACEKVVEVVILTLEMKKRREAGMKAGDG
ncbi:MAG: hypothetical protein TREMPRED_001684 [Tremellales sp. Tagirdzhanova-0007]|nr:MAG: hypothetical protein TREMPRED_001684 [Tremellales sp. Tagirdzhanova-0007]